MITLNEILQKGYKLSKTQVVVYDNAVRFERGESAVYVIGASSNDDKLTCVLGTFTDDPTALIYATPEYLRKNGMGCTRVFREKVGTE